MVSSIYFPETAVESSPADIGLAFDEIFFKSSGGAKLQAWFVKASSSAPVVIFCHGNAGNISHRLAKIKLLNSIGLSVFIFDYRGYGRSSGKPSEKGMYFDAEAAYDWLVSKNIPREKIIFYGESIGSAVAVELALRRGPAALILESPFLSIREMAKKVLPGVPDILLCAWKYDNLAKLPKISSPILVLHSRHDEMVPFGMGVKLFEAANVPKEFVELDGGHNEGYAVSGKKYINGIAGFTAKHVKTRR